MITLGVLLASAQSAAPPPVIHAPAPPPLDPYFRRQGFSEAGIAILKTDVGNFDPRIQQARRAMEAMDSEIDAAIGATPLDLDRVKALQVRRDVLEARYRALRTDQVMAIAAAMPAEDRRLFLRLFTPTPPGYHGSPRRRGPPAPPAPPPPPR